jgi:hypothetical protein
MIFGFSCPHNSRHGAFKIIRKALAKFFLWAARWASPTTNDDLRRLEIYNENLNEELRKERNRRLEDAGEIRWLKHRVTELKEALKANERKENVN